MQKTSIQWTDMTANPIRARCIDGSHRIPGHFCQKISPGCANCYASKLQPRFGMPQFPGTNKGPAEMGVELFLDEKCLQSLLRRRKPCRVFLCDMTDLFGDWVPFELIDKIFAVMALTPHVTYQILTKRPERMAEYLTRRVEDDDGWPVGSGAWDGIGRVISYWQEGGADWLNAMNVWSEEDGLMMARHLTDPITMPLPNVWLGTSCEDQQRADERIPWLLKCPAAIRFLSIEPQIGPIDFWNADRDGLRGGMRGAIHWMIQGGESGPNARPFDLRWARDIRDQCAIGRIAYFLKQLGAHPVAEVPGMEATRGVNQRYFGSGWSHLKFNDSHGGDEAEWPSDLIGCREFPAEGGAK